MENEPPLATPLIILLLVAAIVAISVAAAIGWTGDHHPVVIPSETPTPADGPPLYPID